MNLIDILHLALRNLRQAKLRAGLTMMGVIVGVAVIVTMVSFGLGLQRNMLARFKALDLFNEMNVFGKSLAGIASGFDRNPGRDPERDRPARILQSDKAPTRMLDDAAIAEVAKLPGVAYVEPNISFVVYVRANGHALAQMVGGAAVPNASSRFKEFVGGRMMDAAGDEVVVNERFTRNFGFAKPADAVGQTIEFLTPADNRGAAKKPVERQAEEPPPNFFGIPLEEEPAAPS